MANKTQRRGTCPACFNAQALRGDAMVDHGYQCPWYTGGRRGACAGVHRPHFGTPAGRDVTAGYAADLRRRQEALFRRAADVRAGRVEAHQYEIVSPPHARPWLWGWVARPGTSPDAYASHLERESWTFGSLAQAMEARVAAWAPQDPVVVAVEEKAPYIHLLDGRGNRACALMRVRDTTRCTTDTAAVTCPRCRARIAYAAERARAAAEERPA